MLRVNPPNATRAVADTLSSVALGIQTRVRLAGIWSERDDSNVRHLRSRTCALQSELAIVAAQVGLPATNALIPGAQAGVQAASPKGPSDARRLDARRAPGQNLSSPAWVQTAPIMRTVHSTDGRVAGRPRDYRLMPICCAGRFKELDGSIFCAGASRTWVCSIAERCETSRPSDSARWALSFV